MIVGIPREIKNNEYRVGLLRPGQVVFTCFHFAADGTLFDGFLRSGAVAIAYETIQDKGGTLPLLTPMSEIAGQMAVHEGAKHLEKPMQGRGLLLAGVPGVAPAKIVINQPLASLTELKSRE